MERFGRRQGVRVVESFDTEVQQEGLNQSCGVG